MEERQMFQAFHAAHLIVKYIQGELTDDEQQQLDGWIEQSEANRNLFSEMTNPEKLNSALNEFARPDKAAAWERLNQRIFVGERKRKIISLSFILKIAAITIIALILGWLALRSINGGTKKDAEPLMTNVSPNKQPGGKKAQLQIDGKTTIDLESASDASFTGSGVRINKDQGILSYDDVTGNISKHTIMIPRGGEYQLVLEDGTKVWINAASSLSFPTRFEGKDRRVELTGEAFFEVAHNAQKPFIVQSNDLQIEALGTSFNVYSYSDEPSTRTTLVEGKVRVHLGGQVHMLKPGKTAESANGKVSIRNANIEQETGWRSGVFSFNNTGIREVMNQLGRWYDVDVKFEEGVLSNHITGEISRSDSLKTALEKLAYTGGAKFAIENNSVIVLKGN